MTAGGEIIVDTIVAHSSHIQTLYDQSGIRMERSTINKIYENERSDHVGHDVETDRRDINY